jgi:hypothetical protein
MGRPRQWDENMTARFPRMLAALKDGETKTDFIREAVERELKRRERRCA